MPADVQQTVHVPNAKLQRTSQPCYALHALLQARVKEQETQKKLFNIKRVVCIGGGVALVLVAWALLVASSGRSRVDPGGIWDMCYNHTCFNMFCACCMFVKYISCMWHACWHACMLLMSLQVHVQAGFGVGNRDRTECSGGVHCWDSRRKCSSRARLQFVQAWR
jgi:hypothetical protein